MTPESVYIAGTGTCLPPRLSVEKAIRSGLCDAESLAGTSLLAVTVADDRSAPPALAARAAKVALTRAGRFKVGVDIVLHANVHEQHTVLGNAACHVQRVTAGTDCPAIEIRQASNGGMAAVDLAMAYLSRSGHPGGALITTADIFTSPDVDRWHTDPGLVLADGGTAVMLSTSGGFARIAALEMTSAPELEGMHRFGDPFGEAQCATTPLNARESTGRYISRAGSSYTLEQMKAGMRNSTKRALAVADTSIAEIDWFLIPHFGRARMRTNYLKPLGIPLEKTTWSWSRTVGHLGAGDQFASLNHLVETRKLRPGQRCLMMGVGAGFSWSCAVLEIVDKDELSGEQS